MFKRLLLINTMILSFLLAFFHDNSFAVGVLGLLLFTNGYLVGFFTAPNNSKQNGITPVTLPNREQDQVSW